MELILWRHADAEPGGPDLSRKLTAKGEKQAHRIAEWLQKRLPHTTKVYVSPARRAQQTAQALVDISPLKLRIRDELAPGATVSDLLSAAGWPNSKAAVVIVGHQPTLGLVASQLLSAQTRDWSIKKGGLWWLSRNELNGDDQVVLRAVINPDLV